MYPFRSPPLGFGLTPIKIEGRFHKTHYVQNSKFSLEGFSFFVDIKFVKIYSFHMHLLRLLLSFAKI